MRDGHHRALEVRQEAARRWKPQAADGDRGVIPPEQTRPDSLSGFSCVRFFPSPPSRSPLQPRHGLRVEVVGGCAEGRGQDNATLRPALSVSARCRSRPSRYLPRRPSTSLPVQLYNSSTSSQCIPRSRSSSSMMSGADSTRRHSATRRRSPVRPQGGATAQLLGYSDLDAGLLRRRRAAFKVPTTATRPFSTMRHHITSPTSRQVLDGGVGRRAAQRVHGLWGRGQGSDATTCDTAPHTGTRLPLPSAAHGLSACWRAGGKLRIHAAHHTAPRHLLQRALDLPAVARVQLVLGSGGSRVGT